MWIKSKKQEEDPSFYGEVKYSPTPTLKRPPFFPSAEALKNSACNILGIQPENVMNCETAANIRIELTLDDGQVIVLKWED